MTWRLFLTLVVVSVLITVGVYALSHHYSASRLDECRAAGGNLVVATTSRHRACVKVVVIDGDL